MIRPTGLLALPRRLCYAVAGAALAGSLACSDGRPPPDAGPAGDLAVADRPVIDVAASDARPEDLALDLDAAMVVDGAKDAGRRNQGGVVFPYECTNKDSMADVQPPCPEGEQVTTTFPPECPPGCRAVGLG